MRLEIAKSMIQSKGTNDEKTNTETDCTRNFFKTLIRLNLIKCLIGLITDGKKTCYIPIHGKRVIEASGQLNGQDV